MTVDIVNLASTVGFPIALSCYLLLRFEKKLSENTKAITNLIAFLNGVDKNARRRK